MTPWDDIELTIERPGQGPEALLIAAEHVLENWLEGRGQRPAHSKREGFRLLALHRQGAIGVPSFNAARETCREIAYHYNLLAADSPDRSNASTLAMMVMVTRHLMLFVRGKMEVAGLGEFCCSSRPVRALDRAALD